MASPKYDIIPTMSPFLDPHMILPLIQFLETLNIYKPEQLLKAKLSILNSTNMLDYVMELSDTESSPDFQKRRDDVVAILFGLRQASQPLLDLFESGEEVDDEDKAASAGDNDQNDTVATGLSEIEKLKSENRLIVSTLEENYGITPSIVSAFSQYSKFQYECGFYQDAATYLDVVRVIDPEASFNALWGKLASEILMMQWDDTAVDDAMVDLLDLQKQIDARDSQIGMRTASGNAINSLEQLQMRSWWMHWSLFVFFSHPEGRTKLVETFLYQVQYQSAIQINCPHLLRYLVVAAILSKSKWHTLNDIVMIIEQEHDSLNDAATDFLYYLCAQFDLEKALDTLRDCESMMKTDYFLHQFTSQFMDAAKRLVFETYARVHTTIDTKMVCSQLRMSPDDAERWIADLIRSSKKLDAKIDSEQGQVIIAHRYNPDAPSQIHDATKQLVSRTQRLSNAIAKMQNEGLM